MMMAVRSVASLRGMLPVTRALAPKDPLVSACLGLLASIMQLITLLYFWCSRYFKDSLHVSTFRPRGVPGPTSKLSPRAPAQIGRREMEHEGGKKQAKGKPAAFVLPCAQVGCACSRGLQASAWERARALCAGSFSRAANLFVREPWTFLL
jgi:hypothetical protein